MALDTNINNILVETLDDDAFNTPFFVMNHPFFDRMKKVDAGGSGFRIPIQTGMGGGRGSDFKAGLGHAANGGFTSDAFDVKPAWAFGHATIDWNQQPYTATPQSPADIAMTALKNSMGNCTEDLANLVLSSLGHGVNGVINANTNPTGNQFKLVLGTPTDASKWNLGQVGRSKATATSTSYDAGTFTVLGVNEIEGSILVDGGGTWTPTNTHVIGLDGELDLSSTTTGFPSVFQWVPPVSSRTLGAVGDTFLGVARTTANQVVATSGWAFDGRNNSRLRAVNAAASKMARYKNATPDTVYCNLIQLPSFASECQQQVRYDIKSKSGVDVFFAGFTIITPAGPVDVLGEPGFPSDQMLVTKADSWVYASPNGRKLFGPATNNKVLVDAYGLTEGNVSRASVMSTGFFGCENLVAASNILVDIPA